MNVARDMVIGTAFSPRIGSHHVDAAEVQKCENCVSVAGTTPVNICKLCSSWVLGRSLPSLALTLQDGW